VSYEPIEGYGVIGDMHTAALVSRRGSIDWLCMPKFDAPTVFARLLDDERGGHFSIAPSEEEAVSRQMYWPDTNVLVTRFLNQSGAAELVDFMPVAGQRPECRQIVRRVTCMRGRIRMRVECEPAFNYARDSHEVGLSELGAEFVSETGSMVLATGAGLEVCGGGPGRPGVRAEFELCEGQSEVFVLREGDGERCGHRVDCAEAEELFRATVRYWRQWLSGCTYSGRWREMVHRSALALKLLTYEPTGAIVAAVTGSLPESVGGVRNWDYRYTWIRDSAFTMYALLRLGFAHEAGAYMRFLTEACSSCGDGQGPLQVLYTIDGGTEATEVDLDHLDGYMGSRPVRIGNGAAAQLQLDIIGELMDAAYIYNKWGEPVSSDMWGTLRRFVDWVCENWDRPDASIWEVRGGHRDFVYSRLMCWVAVDRGLRLADKRSFPVDRARWQRVRDEIYEQILERGWSDSLGSFVQAYEHEALDASALVMPLVFFMAPTDPKMLRTLDAIQRSPGEGGLMSNSLVFRYNLDRTEDGLDGEEGTFNICTFWLVEALTRAGRFDPARLENARLIFERMLGYSNHLGLFAEQTGLHGEALGNFPQGLTHISLISAAFNLDRALGGGV